MCWHEFWLRILASESHCVRSLALGGAFDARLGSPRCFGSPRLLERVMQTAPFVVWLVVATSASLAIPAGNARAQGDGGPASITIIGPKPVQADQRAACTPVATAADLNNIRNNRSGNYCLTRDINAALLGNFVPIGDDATPFQGVLDGRGHVIRNLKINSSASYVGLFGYTVNATIKNLGLINAQVFGGSGVTAGALAGFVGARSVISRSFATGKFRVKKLVDWSAVSGARYPLDRTAR